MEALDPLHASTIGWLAPHVGGRVVVLARGAGALESQLRELGGQVTSRHPAEDGDLPPCEVVVLEAALAWSDRLAGRLPADTVVLVVEPHAHRRGDGLAAMDVRETADRLVAAGVDIDRLELSDGTVRVLGHVAADAHAPDLSVALRAEHALLLDDQRTGLAAARSATTQAAALASSRVRTRDRERRLQNEIARARVQLEDDATVRRLRRKLRGSDQRTRELEQRARALERRVARLLAKQKRFEQRRWWRLGRLLGDVRRSPARVFRLPLDVLRLLRPPPAPQPRDGAAPRAAEPARIASRSGADAPAAAAHVALSPGARIVVELPVIPRIPAPDVVPARPGLRVAGVVDAFSEMAFGHEFDLLQLDRRQWRDEFDEFRPDVLFIESAWHGKDRKWVKAIGSDDGPSDDLRELVARARAAGVPTVFWNKEDPPNYDRFAPTAALFDRVYTVDEDCVERYAEVLGADRVGVLPFAAQPAIHNPVAVPGGRAYPVAFAGTYFPHKHPLRREQMAAILEPAAASGLHIFSRNEHDPRYRFPEPLDRHVVGSLAYDDMVTAYKRYKVFLNVNSVVGSRTTCSRRIFELAAAGTAVLSGPSPAIDHLLGRGVVAQASNQEEARASLQVLLGGDEVRDRATVRGIRAVHGTHAYRHRVDRIVEDLGLGSGRPTRRRVSIVAPTMRPENLPLIAENLRRQTQEDLQLVLVTHGFEASAADIAPLLEGSNVTDLVLRSAPAELTLGAITNLGLEATDGELVTKMDDDDYYGAEYLRDQQLAFTYSGADIVGKRSLFAYLGGMDATVLRWPGSEHTFVSFVAGPTMMARRETWQQLRFPEGIRRGMDTEVQRRAVEQGMRIYATDRFNFVLRRGGDVSGHTWDIADHDVVASGRVAYFGWNPAHVEV